MWKCENYISYPMTDWGYWGGIKMVIMDVYWSRGDKTDSLDKNRTQWSLLSHLSQHSLLIPHKTIWSKTMQRTFITLILGTIPSFSKESSWSVIVSSFPMSHPPWHFLFVPSKSGEELLFWIFDNFINTWSLNTWIRRHLWLHRVNVPRPEWVGTNWAWSDDTLLALSAMRLHL